LEDVVELEVAADGGGLMQLLGVQHFAFLGRVHLIGIEQLLVGLVGLFCERGGLLRFLKREGVSGRVTEELEVAGTRRDDELVG
jgi:predicted RNA-binding protein